MASQLRVDKIVPVDGIGSDSGNNRYGGGVIQVVQSYGDGSEKQTTSTSYVATGTAATITPKFSTSKIMVEVMGGTCAQSVEGNGMDVSVYRSINGGTFTAMHGVSGRPSESLWRMYNNSGRVQMGCAIKFLDAPATTDSVEYKVYVASNGGGECQFNNHFNDHASIILTEHSA